MPPVAPAIPLLIDYEVNAVQRHNHSYTPDGDPNERITVQIPVLSETATARELLTFTESFKRLGAFVGWTNGDGEKLFSKFPLHLVSSHVLIWDEIVEDREQTEAEFDDAICQFKGAFLSNNDYIRQLAFVRHLKKPKDMTPTRFLTVLKQQNSYLAQMPFSQEYGTSVGDFELHHIYF